MGPLLRYAPKILAIPMLLVRTTSIFIVLFAVAAILVAYTQVLGISPDYENYSYFFDNIRYDFYGTMASVRFEPGFSAASGVAISLFQANVTAYSSLVFLSILAKLIFMRKFSNAHFFALSVMLYFIKYFPLLELTQLRASMAASFLIAASYFSWSKQRIRGIVAAGIAFSFHYSSLIVAPLLFIPKMDRRKSIMLFLIALLAFTLLKSILFKFAGSYFVALSTYGASGQPVQTLKAFSAALAPEFFLMAGSLFYWRDLTDTMQRVVTLQLIGFALWFGFLDIPIIAVRGRELFSVLWVLYVAQGYNCRFDIRLIIYIFILMSAALGYYVYFYLDFFHEMIN